MPRILSVVTVLSALLACGNVRAQQAPTQKIGHPVVNQPVELSLGKFTPLRAVLQIAAQYKIPLGIVFGIRPLLCSQARPTTTIRAANFLDALSQRFE